MRKNMRRKTLKIPDKVLKSLKLKKIKINHRNKSKIVYLYYYLIVHMYFIYFEH